MDGAVESVGAGVATTIAVGRFGAFLGEVGLLLPVSRLPPLERPADVNVTRPDAAGSVSFASSSSVSTGGSCTVGLLVAAGEDFLLSAIFLDGTVKPVAMLPIRINEIGRPRCRPRLKVAAGGDGAGVIGAHEGTTTAEYIFSTSS